MNEDQKANQQTTRGWLPTPTAAVAIVLVTPVSAWLLHQGYGAMAVSVGMAIGYIAGALSEMSLHA